MRRRTGRAASFGLLMPLLACGPSDDRGAAVSHAPRPIADESGAVCGMLVRDQPAPRAQVVHRDGERAFLCSIADLLAYLAVPSPHGGPTAVLVEVLEPGVDPGELRTGSHPWLAAEAAAYVVGVPRPGVMGEPVLVYRDVAAARRVAAGEQARVLDFAELQRWWASRHGE